MKKLVFVTALIFMAASCKNEAKKTEENTTIEEERMAMSQEPTASSFDITPISHATAVFEWDGTIFYIDPVGGATAFEGQPEPDVILITDIHGDHLNAETVSAVVTPETKIYAPQAVLDQMEGDVTTQVTVIDNDETIEMNGFSIKGIPMYNLREEAKQFHTKGRGNGYLIEKNDMRVYFSGDTEDIPEMRNLKNIDKAFVCMNLPYTMPVDSAADAVLDFKPKEVYPYHYRGQGGLSDVDQFKSLVNEGDASIDVVLLNWYPNREE